MHAHAVLYIPSPDTRPVRSAPVTMPNGTTPRPAAALWLGHPQRQPELTPRVGARQACYTHTPSRVHGVRSEG